MTRPYGFGGNWVIYIVDLHHPAVLKAGRCTAWHLQRNYQNLDGERKAFSNSHRMESKQAFDRDEQRSGISENLFKHSAMEVNRNPSQTGERREDGVVQFHWCLACEGKEDLRNPMRRPVSPVKQIFNWSWSIYQLTYLFNHGGYQPQHFSWIANVEQSLHPVRLAQHQLSEELCQKPSSALMISKFA